MIERTNLICEISQNIARMLQGIKTPPVIDTYFKDLMSKKIEITYAILYIGTLAIT